MRMEDALHSIEHMSSRPTIFDRNSGLSWRTVNVSSIADNVCPRLYNELEQLTFDRVLQIKNSIFDAMRSKLLEYSL